MRLAGITNQAETLMDASFKEIKFGTYRQKYRYFGKRRQLLRFCHGLTRGDVIRACPSEILRAKIDRACQRPGRADGCTTDFSEGHFA